MRTGRALTLGSMLLAATLALTGCVPVPPADTASDPAAAVEPQPPAASTDLSPSATPTPDPTPTAVGAAQVPNLPGRAPSQSFAVGTRQLDLTRGNRPLRTVVWYPAAGSGGAQAAPADGVFPLILFSHGLTAIPESYQRIASRIAAAGFIVAAPAYPYTNGNASTYNPTDLVNQPADGSAVITAMLALNGNSGDPLAGHIDPTRIAAGGHSAGGYTTAGLLAGGRDNRLTAGIVIAGGSLGGSFTGPSASVLFIHGDQDPIVSYGIGRSTYNLVPWPKAFLTVTGGDHTSYLFGSSTASNAVTAGILDFLRVTLYGDGAAGTRLPGVAGVSGSTTFETSL